MIDQLSEKHSVRRTCIVLGFRRQTYYRRKTGNRPEAVDAAISELLNQTTQRFIAWGFWKVFHYLRNQGYAYNHKKVYRIWKQEGLHLRLPPKRKRLHRKYQALLAPKRVNEGWAMDFVSDWVVGPFGQRIRIINIMDERSRRALWTEAHEHISADKLVEVLDKVLDYRGKPTYIRCDNGPEFISQKLASWATEHHVELKFIQAGKPSQNGLIERLNKTLRTECLNLSWFHSLEELNEKIQDWSQVYNLDRPHKSLGHISPEDFEQQNKILYFDVVAA
jgi:putative transposase